MARYVLAKTFVDGMNSYHIHDWSTGRDHDERLHPHRDNYTGSDYAAVTQWMNERETQPLARPTSRRTRTPRKAT